ncbi:MAG: DUF5665 domain-containing protein [Peptococcaceae bacterium]|nr:DUF5665 domain-containing protein [Peptococcaceae bacterium]
MAEEGELESRLQEELQRFNLNLEKMKLGRYVMLLQKPGRLLYLNFLSGLANGVGMAVGFAILGAIVVYILQRLLLWHLPVISGYIAEIVRLVQFKLQSS